jgi:hypothetical protein
MHGRWRTLAVTRNAGALRDVPRETSIRLADEITKILASGEVGSLALILDGKDVIHLLGVAVEREGSISAFTKRHRLQRANLTDVLNGKRPVSRSVVKILGLQNVYTHQKKDNRR